MKIKTEHNIRDRVWAIDYAYGKWFVDDVFTIVEIHVDEIDEKIECYYVEYCEYRHNVKNCFTTREQAQAECDKRNKGEQQ